MSFVFFIDYEIDDIWIFCTSLVIANFFVSHLTIETDKKRKRLIELAYYSKSIPSLFKLFCLIIVCFSTWEVFYLLKLFSIPHSYINVNKYKVESKIES